MAKVELSALLDSITGKLSGSVFQNTVGGLQLRARVSPRDPKTPSQQKVRGTFGFNAASWSLLSDADRATWNDNAPMGSTGIAFYLQTNSRIGLTGEPLLNAFSPSTAPVITAISLETILFDDIGVVTPATPLDTPANTWLLIYATRNQTPGTSFITGSAYKFLKAIPPATTIATERYFSTEYVAQFGVMNVGWVVGAAYLLIDVATGLQSIQSFTTGTVQP